MRIQLRPQRAGRWQGHEAGVDVADTALVALNPPTYALPSPNHDFSLASYALLALATRLETIEIERPDEQDGLLAADERVLDDLAPEGQDVDDELDIRLWSALALAYGSSLPKELLTRRAPLSDPYLSGLPQLVVLDLSKPGTGSVDDAGVLALRQLLNLAVLDLSGNGSVTDHGLGVLSYPGGPSALRALSLRGCQAVTSSGLRKAAEGWSSLQVLDARNTACKKYSTTIPGFRSRPDAERADTLFYPRSALEVARSILSVREPLVLVDTLDFPAPRRRVPAERKPVVTILCPIRQDAETPPSPFAAPLPTLPTSDFTPLPTFAQLAPQPASDSAFPSSAWALARRPRIIPPPPSIQRTPLPFELARPAKRRRTEPSPIARPAAAAALGRLDGSETLMFVRVAPTPSTSSSAADSKPKTKTEGEVANVRRAPKQSGYLAGVLKARKVNVLSTPDVTVAGAVEKPQAQAQARKAVPFGRRADGNGKQGLSTWHSVPEAQDGVVALQGEEETFPPTRTAVPFGRRIVTAKQARPVDTEEGAVVLSRQALAKTALARLPGSIDQDEDDVVEVVRPLQALASVEGARPRNSMPGQAKTSCQGSGAMKQTTLSFSKPKR